MLKLLMLLPIAYNATQLAELPNGGRVVDFRGKWVNLLDADLTWKRIDVALRNDSGRWGVDDAPFSVRLPQFANGTAEFHSTCRANIFDKTTISDPAFSMSITPMGVNAVDGIIDPVDPTRIVYAGAYGPHGNPTGDLIYHVYHGRAPRLMKLVRINRLPGGTGPIRIAFRIGHDVADCWTTDRTLTVADEDTVRQIGVDVRNELGKLNNSIPTLMAKQFLAREWVKKRWSGTLKTTTKGLILRKDQATGLRGCGFKNFTAWDDSGNRIPIQVEIERSDAGTFTLTKIVPRAFIEQALARGESVWTDTTSTFYPDPNTETTSVDGGCTHELGFGSGVSWATLIAAAGNTASSTSTDIGPASSLADGLKCSMDSTSNQYVGMSRYACLFDTSTIDDGDSVTAAVLSVRGTSKENSAGVSPTYNIYTSAPASNTDVVAGDYDSFGSTAQCDTALAYADYSTTGYNDWTLNATGRGNVSKTGVSKLGLRNANYDVAAAAPTWGAFLTFEIRGRSADYTGTDNDPKLVVTHAPPTYTASSSLTTGKATTAVSLTHTPPSYTATSALTTGKATASASATFAPGTKTAASALNAAPVTLAASVEFDAPVFTASAALTTAPSTAEASATFAPGTKTATSAVTAAATTLAASAQHVTPVYTASSAMAVAAVTAAADATFSPGTKTASAALTTGATTIAASLEFDAPVYTASAALTSSAATLASVATFVSNGSQRAAVMLLLMDL